MEDVREQKGELRHIERACMKISYEMQKNNVPHMQAQQ